VAEAPTKEPRYIANLLYKVILQYDCLEKIILDQEHKFFKCLVDRLEELTASSDITSGYQPQSNGVKELFFFLKTQLQKRVNEHQDNWDDFLDNICMCSNSEEFLHCGIFAVYH